MSFLAVFWQFFVFLAVFGSSKRAGSIANTTDLRIHNPEVASSNLAPATSICNGSRPDRLRAVSFFGSFFGSFIRGSSFSRRKLAAILRLVSKTLP